jgi:hypothetical protein
MSTALHDVAAAAFLVPAVFPGTRTAPVTGPALDMLSGDGPCFAVQQVGGLADDTTLTGGLEESATGTGGWSAIPGATFAQVGSANNVQVCRFTRTQRYVRYVGTLTGETPSVELAVLVGQQTKTL